MRRAKSAPALPFPAPPAWLLQQMKQRQEFADEAVCERLWEKISQPHNNKLYMDPAQQGYDVSVENLLPNGKYGEKVLLVPGQIFETPNSLLRNGLNRIHSALTAAQAAQSWGQIREATFGAQRLLSPEELHEIAIVPAKKIAKLPIGKKLPSEARRVFNVLHDSERGHSLSLNDVPPQIVPENPPGRCILLGLQSHVDNDTVTVTDTSPFFSLGSSLCSMVHLDDFRLPGSLSLIRLRDDHPENGKLWIFFSGPKLGVNRLISQGHDHRLTLDDIDMDTCIVVWQPLGYTVFLPMGLAHSVSTFFYPDVQANCRVTVALPLTWIFKGNIEQMRLAHASITNDRFGKRRERASAEYEQLNELFAIPTKPDDNHKLVFKKAAGIVTKKDRMTHLSSMAASKRKKKLE